MSDDPDTRESRPDLGLDDEEAAVRRLLQRVQTETQIPTPPILPGVQRKIRERSRGRFYRDGWSTTQTRTSTYIITSLLVLIIVGLVYFVLVPGVLRPQP